MLGWHSIGTEHLLTFCTRWRQTFSANFEELQGTCMELIYVQGNVLELYRTLQWVWRNETTMATKGEILLQQHHHKAHHLMGSSRLQTQRMTKRLLEADNGERRAYKDEMKTRREARPGGIAPYCLWLLAYDRPGDSMSTRCIKKLQVSHETRKGR